MWWWWGEGEIGGNWTQNNVLKIWHRAYKFVGGDGLAAEDFSVANYFAN